MDLGIGQRIAGVTAVAGVVLLGVLAAWRWPGGERAAHLWPVAAPTWTATATPTHTASPTASATATATRMPSPTPTNTPSPSVTPSPSATPTATPNPTATATPSPTQTPEPQPTSDGTLRTLRVPILMYHYISDPPVDADAIRRDLSVGPAQFGSHLQALRAAGYQTITLHDLVLAFQIGHPLPERPIVLTFDDGYRDNYEYAFPLLQQYGYIGTFFLVTGFVDEARPEYVTWLDVIEMHAAGMEIGAHSYTHPDLRNRDVDYLVWQMLGPKEAIEARIGEPVRFFCYPSGKYDQACIDVLHSAGYWGAATVRAGVENRSDAPFEWRRIRVHGGTDAATLLATIDYWLSAEVQ